MVLGICFKVGNVFNPVRYAIQSYIVGVEFYFGIYIGSLFFKRLSNEIYLESFPSLIVVCSSCVVKEDNRVSFVAQNNVRKLFPVYLC